MNASLHPLPAWWLPQLCTIGDLIMNEECQRVAQWVWRPEPDDHPIYLCNFHAEPFTASPGMTA